MRRPRRMADLILADCNLQRARGYVLALKRAWSWGPGGSATNPSLVAWRRQAIEEALLQRRDYWRIRRELEQQAAARRERGE